MKKVFIISLLSLALAITVNVSCAAVKVPAATCEPEKAVLPTLVGLPAIDHGAISKLTIQNFDGGVYVVYLSLDKITWVTDESFYLTGYKALLSKAVREIIAPPDLG